MCFFTNTFRCLSASVQMASGNSTVRKSWGLFRLVIAWAVIKFRGGWLRLMATYKVSVMTLYESDDTSPGESFKMSDFYHYTFYD